jgi:hypothetical protein
VSRRLARLAENDWEIKDTIQFFVVDHLIGTADRPYFE